MKLILDTENSNPTTITVKWKEITLLLIELSVLIDSTQIAKIFDKKEKTVATKVQKSKLEKYETENIKLLKNYGLMTMMQLNLGHSWFKANVGRASILLLQKRRWNWPYRSHY